jgi:hypothetical protein
MSSSVLKTLKRSMAAEYSRELSVKVFSGQCRLIELGFRQGGPAGYGLRRQLMDSQLGAQRSARPRRAEEPQTDRGTEERQINPKHGTGFWIPRQ